MTTLNWFTVMILAAFMTAAAVGMGRWAESVNPEGIRAPVAASESAPATTGTQPEVVAESTDARDAFSFGASIGLLGSALLYATLAIGLLIRAKTTGRSPSQLTYWVAGLAGVGLALSYLVDDYFY